MLPIIFDEKAGFVLLVGEGERVEQRLAMLEAAGCSLRVFSLAPSKALVKQAGDRLSQAWPTADDLAEAGLVFGAGLDDQAAEELALMARHIGVLVNIEDVASCCDFHMPAMVRRGDLLMTVSTGGKSPGLAKRLRQHLEGLFGKEWSGHLEVIARRRAEWRTEGMGLKEIAQRTDGFIDQQGWLS